MNSPIISIIVPSYNDQEAVIRNVSPLLGHAACEVIVVHAGNTDCTLPGATVLQAAIPNRAAQMNQGAAVARGELLVFLHADTILNAEAIIAAHCWLKDHPLYVGGAFRFRLDDSPWQARFMELGVRLRECLFRLPYGDQALFVWEKIFSACRETVNRCHCERSEAIQVAHIALNGIAAAPLGPRNDKQLVSRHALFTELGGYPHVAFLEDVMLVQALKKRGRLYFAPDPAVTSARKWRQHGYFRMMLVNWGTMLLWKTGHSPEKLLSFRQRYLKPHHKGKKHERDSLTPPG